MTPCLPKGDALETYYMERMLDNFSASYKLYWFQGIMKEIIAGKQIIHFRTVIAQMLAAAWFPVIYYHLSLGYQDKMADIIHYANIGLELPRETKKDDIVTFFERCDDKKLIKEMESLTKMVPTRLIRPFYEKQIKGYRQAHVDFQEYKTDSLIRQLNDTNDDAVFYRIDEKHGIISVSDHWAEYIRRNHTVIQGWLNYKLVQYLQRRNPSVPAIASKIDPPMPEDRNLTDARKLWDDAGRNAEITDIYTGRRFNAANITQLGGVSIDHFIPWSFVLHNEIWNLCPCFKVVNSSKSDQLPDLKTYLDVFCEQQFKMFITLKDEEKHKKMMQEYLAIKGDAMQLNDNTISHSSFTSALKNTIQPLYQIAINQGYGTWTCDAKWMSKDN